MKIKKTKTTIWYLKDDFEFLQARVAILKSDLKVAKVLKANLVNLYMPPQPPETFWIEDEEHEEEDILYVTRKWVKKEDMIWMESL